MTIETKFNIGDEVWFMSRSKCASSQVKGVRIYSIDGKYSYRSSCIEIDYDLGDYGSYEEFNLFRTKEELLDSL